MKRMIIITAFLGLIGYSLLDAIDTGIKAQTATSNHYILLDQADCHTDSECEGLEDIDE